MFNGDRLSVWEDKKVPETDGGDSCTMMLISLNSTLRMVKMVSLML